MKFRFASLLVGGALCAALLAADVDASSIVGGGVSTDTNGNGIASQLGNLCAVYSHNRVNFCDDFSRPNTSAGVIGTPPDGSSYTLKGTGGVVADTESFISGHRWTSTVVNALDASYAWHQSNAPINHIGGCFRFVNAGGAGAVASAVFVISNTAPGSGFTQSLPIHITVSQAQMVIAEFKNNTFSSLKTIVMPNGGLTTGKDYCLDVVIDGTIIRYSIAGLVGTFVNNDIPFVGVGTWCYWELFYNSNTPPATPAFDAVWAGNDQVGVSDTFDLVMAAWHFDTTGWTDATGDGNTLTAVNAPTLSSGLINGAAKLVGASSMKFTASDSQTLELGSRDWTISTWVNPASLPAASHYASILDKTTDINHMEYGLYLDGTTDKFQCYASNDGTFAHSTTVGSSQTASINTWYNVVCQYESNSQTLSITVNNVAGAIGTLTTTFVGTNGFTIGYDPFLNGVQANPYWDGLIDETEIYSSIPGHGGFLRNGRVTALYNDGQGLGFPNSNSRVMTVNPVNPLNFVTAPTIAGAGCGGSAASISANNGTAAFDINVGTAPTSGGCTVTMPAAITRWNCHVNDFTTISTGVFVQKETSSTTTSVVLQNYSDVAVATAPTASDIYHVECMAE